MHEALFKIYQRADETLEPVLGQVDIQCHSCPYNDVCCTSFVSVTSIEADGIVDHLIETGQWSHYVGKLKRQERRAPKSYLKFIDDRDNQCLQWFLKKVYCAFYDHKAKKCGIYEQRPLMCRGLFAALGTRCDKGESQTIQLMRQYIDVAVNLSLIVHVRDEDEPAGELAHMVLEAMKRRR